MIEAPTIAPSSGAIESTASQRIAFRRSPLWLRMKLTVFIPSAKSCERTATNTSSPVVVSRPNARPIPRPSMKLCSESPAAPRAPTCACAARLLGLVAMVEDERRSARKKKRKPAPTSVPTRVRVLDRLERLGQDVEERDTDHDAARERDQRRQLAPQPQRDRAAEERRDDGQRGRAGSRSRSLAVLAGAVDLELVRLGAEAVPAGERPLARRGAELGVLDRAAAEADEVVVVLGGAADVGRPPLAGERVQRPGPAQELERAVGRGEAEPGGGAPRTLEELDGREAAARGLDRVQHGAPLGRQPRARRAAPALDSRSSPFDRRAISSPNHS